MPQHYGHNSSKHRIVLAIANTNEFNIVALSWRATKGSVAISSYKNEIASALCASQ